MTWQKLKINSFLKERENRIKPSEANKMGLKRLNKIDFSGEIHLTDKNTNTDMILVKPGDLVISGINVEKGAVAVYQGKEDILATIHYSAYIFDKNKIDIEYFKVFLRSKAFKDTINTQIRGGIKTELKAKKFLPLEIHLPDIDTQIEIKNKLNKKIEQVNNCSNIEEKNLSLLSSLRSSILQQAVQGKLVPQDPKDEPASELLKKIKAEKERLIKQKKLKLGKSTDSSKSFIEEYYIPKTWAWCKTDDILFITKLAGFEYTEHINLKESGEIPVIRAQNVRPLKIDKTNVLFIDKKTSLLLNRCSLTKKCLLVTFIGAGIGDVATFDEKERWHLAPNVAKMEPFEGCDELISLRFINYFLMSEIGQREIFKHVQATAQPSLSMGTIRDIDIPLPPLAEQKRIVEKVDRLMAYCDELEKQVKENQENAKKLMESVLKEGFKK